MCSLQKILQFSMKFLLKFWANVKTQEILLKNQFNYGILIFILTLFGINKEMKGFDYNYQYGQRPWLF